MHMTVTRQFAGWRVIAVLFVAQNLAMGFTFASFGPLLASTEQHFGVTRTVAATGMSAILLAFAGLSPLSGALLQKVSIRRAMIVAAIITAIGYVGVAFLPNFTSALPMYCVIGAGSSVVGVLGPLALVSRWFAKDRAKALGVICLPIALFVTPFAIGELLPVVGRATILYGIGACFLLLVPLLTLLIDDPAKIGQVPHGAAATAAGSAETVLEDHALTARQILSSSPFWLLSLAIGVMAGSGIVFVVHIVPFGMERHMNLPEATGLLSIYAGAGIFGTMAFGWIADRIGPPASLALSTACQTLIWWGMLHVDDRALYALAALLGVCVVPLNALHGAAVGMLFGPASVSRAMGLSYFIKLPFLFVFAPFTAYLFQLGGSYNLPFQITAALLAVSCLFFVLMTLIVRRQAHASAGSAQAIGDS